MLKNISSLGIILNKAEKQSINGGNKTSGPCYDLFIFCGDHCAIVDRSGNTVFGSIVNGLCCV